MREWILTIISVSSAIVSVAAAIAAVRMMIRIDKPHKAKNHDYI